MNSTQSIQFSQFTPPKVEPILASKSIIFLAINILTLGIYGAAETLSKFHSIKELKLVQEDLQEQVVDLIANWQVLEKELIALLDEYRNLSDEDVEGASRLKSRLEKITAQKEAFQKEELQKDYESVRSISELALSTLSFLGQLFANIITLGLYGVYKNYTLKNRMTFLEAQNTYIQNQFTRQNVEMGNHLQKIIDFALDTLNLKQEFSSIQEEYQDIQKTDVGQAYQKAKKAEQDAALLKKEHTKLQQDLKALEVEKVVAESGKDETEVKLAVAEQDLKELRTRYQLQGDEKFQAEQGRDRLKTDLQKRDTDLLALRVQKAQELADLQDKFNIANLKAQQVQSLERELSRLKTASKNQPEIQKLQAQVGPIPRKYTPGPNDKVMEGEVGITDVSETNKDNWSEYAKRYNSQRTAVDVIKAAFNFGFNELLERSKKENSKFHFSDCAAMQKAPGTRALYRFMVLDLIKGAKLHQPTCHGYELLINNQDVSMVPSEPEKVLRYKYDSKEKCQKPVVETRFSRRDDFTANEDILDRTVPFGVDPVSIKWIWAQLSAAEQEHLMNLLMSSLIDNDEAKYCATQEFMKQKGDPRVLLVKTAYDLVCDMATVVEAKFDQNVFIQCWQENLDTTNISEAFIKEEDKEIAIPKEELVPFQGDANIVDWQLDLDVLGDKRNYDVKGRQTEFADLITFAQQKYYGTSSFIDPLLLNPESHEDEVKLSWELINNQYHVAHQMIGSDAYGNGGVRCLMSNLLAVLVTDKKDLTVENSYKLLKAMAAYLDKLQQAKAKWAWAQKDNNLQTEEAKKLKELADLAKAFETAIAKTHSCTVSQYQAWLRREVYGTANIDIGNLTPLEIQLCAYTLGVKIGLLTVATKGNGKMLAQVNTQGRIVPAGEYYGPNTKECLLMGALFDHKGGTFYSLYPKLDLTDDKREELPEINDDVYQDLIELEAYWQDISLSNSANH